MASRTRLPFLAAIVMLSSSLALGRGSTGAESPAETRHVFNWPAPLLWAPPASARVPGEAGAERAAVATAPLPFIAITPCRVADTRGNGFTGQYGPPSLVANATRSFTITGQCGIAASAAAVSFNFAALNVGAGGDLRVFPAGGDVPLVSTLNYNANTPNIANAAVVPVGTGGAITVQADATAIDLIIDVNGYYDGNGVITGVSPGTGMMGGGTSGMVILGISPGGVTSTELASNAVTSSKIAANAVTAGAIASGQVVKSLNGATDGVTVTGSGLVSVNTAGSTITVGGGGTPSGSLLLGKPNDTTLIGAGYSEIGPSSQDLWTPTAAALQPREQHTAVWTGTRMIVWGGWASPFSFDTGGRYDPVGNSWSATTTIGAPTERFGHTAVWTGSKMIVWGGCCDTDFLNTGGQYDPIGNSWSATTTTGAPTGREYHTAVWTGSKMIVWGGYGGISPTWFNTGGQYDPVGNTWSPTTTAGAPAARDSHTVVWTGSKMIVWGGGDASNRFNTGGQYDPAGNSWTATTTVGAPAKRNYHTAVWTGLKMVVWGGYDGLADVNSGGQYDPVANSWTSTTTTGAPIARGSHTAVWTGSRMIVWGGAEGSSGLSTGGQYDPVANSWTATGTTGAPMGRHGHTAVWTGSKMIVWGGQGPNQEMLNTGGQYGVLSLYVKN